MVASDKRPLIYLTSSNTSKEQAALQVLQQHPVDEGLICILSVVEYCQTLQPKKGKAANKRFLDSMQNIIPAKTIEKEINSICSRKTLKGRNYSGYNVWSADTFLLFETVSDGKYLICGFTNREIRHSINRDNPDSARVKGQTSREFSKLRAHGLIRKIPHSRRYLVSDKGRRVMGALIEAKRKIYPEFAAK